MSTSIALLFAVSGCGFYRVEEKNVGPNSVRGRRRWSVEEYLQHRTGNRWRCYSEADEDTPGDLDTRIYAQADFRHSGTFIAEVGAGGARVVEQGGLAPPSRAYPLLLCGADSRGAAVLVGVAPGELGLYFHTAGKHTYSPSTGQARYVESVGGRISVDVSRVVSPEIWNEYEFVVNPTRMYVTAVPNRSDGTIDLERPAFFFDYRYLRMRPNVVVRRLKLVE